MAIVIAGTTVGTAEGFAEVDVVRAFLETLAPLADKSHHSRQLRRALRRQFRDVGEQAELRRRVAMPKASPPATP
jgi:hypothetical protein